MKLTALFAIIGIVIVTATGMEYGLITELGLGGSIVAISGLGGYVIKKEGDSRQ